VSDPAEGLLALAELERRLVAERRFEELAPLHDERDRLIAALPVPVGPAQAPVLARARALMHEAATLAAAARTELAAELAQLGRGRATARGYASAGLAAAPSVDRVA
jgi:hypothetical protein